VGNSYQRKSHRGSARQAGLWLESGRDPFTAPRIFLAQIHAALSYYYENKDQMDAEILRQRREVERLAAAQRESPLYKKLLALKNG
jgi:hypothetical protein